LRAHRHRVIPGIDRTGTLIAEYLTRRRLSWVATALLASAGSAQATNGLLIPGYGIKAFGMGGASISLPQDSNFRRAVKRWTNQSPNRFRNDLIAEAANDRQVVPYGPPRRYRPMPESSCRASGAIDVTYRIDWLGIGYRYRFEQPLRSEP
jgi:hypothetical protein